MESDKKYGAAVQAQSAPDYAKVFGRDTEAGEEETV